MVRFCDQCANTLTPNYTNDELVFKCNLCNLSSKADPEDSLRNERIKENDITIHEKNFNKAVGDPTSIKAYINCIDTSCKGKIVNQVRIGDDMKLYNICRECKIRWRF